MKLNKESNSAKQSGAETKKKKKRKKCKNQTKQKA